VHLNVFTRKPQANKTLLLFIAMLVFKLACEIGYWRLLSWDAVTYRADFSPAKYLLGLLWCVLLFICINHKERKASAFLLYLFLLTQIIPITTLYALANDDSVYYNLICLAVFACELIVRFVDTGTDVLRGKVLSALMILAFTAMAVFTVYRLIKIYGKPETTALDIYRVYEMRENAPELGKLLNYLLSWTTAVFLPLGLAKTITEKKYLWTLALCAVLFLIYLYTGHKTYMFAIPLVCVCTLWANRRDCHTELFTCFCFGFALLVLFACMKGIYSKSLFSQVYSLIGRRAMIVSANNKFKYYDYFTKNPKLGIAGIFPRWLVDVRSHYDNISYPHEISRIYYRQPGMYSNTGFLAEGYMRFGYPGIFLAVFIFTLFLKGIDSLQVRTSYPFAVGLFVYPVYSLNDAHLIDSLFFGPWMFLAILLIFFRTKDVKQSGRL
jgi:hypothetical protein